MIPQAFPTLLVVCAVALAWTLLLKSTSSPKGKPSLVFPKGRPLKLVLFADVHYGEGEDEWWGPVQDANSTRVMELVLSRENPDFVVFLGDFVTGENLVNATNATDYLGQVFRPVVERGIPFASTYGNHDLSENLPRGQIFAYESKLSLCYTARSDPQLMPGVTNYALQFQSSREPSSDPAFQLVFLDSHGITGLINQTGTRSTNWVTESQLQFLNRSLQGGTPTYVFVHIPPPQFSHLNDAFQNCVGLHDEAVIDVQGQDRGLWNMLLASSNTVAVFAGHDHGSAWCCPSQRTPPLVACFARHTGYGGYGDWARGARVLLINESDPFKVDSWVVMENGERIDKFTQ